MSAEPLIVSEPLAPDLLFVGQKPARLYLLDLQHAYDQAWSYDANWHLGLYFCAQDGRLWVPQRRLDGQPHPERRVINFLHPRARAAFGVWMTGFFVSALGLTLTVAALCGHRW